MALSSPDGMLRNDGLIVATPPKYVLLGTPLQYLISRVRLPGYTTVVCPPGYANWGWGLSQC